MSAAQQIPRNSIIWLLSAQLAVILPHTSRMSWWMIAIWLLCAFWRMAMFRGEASYPGKLIRSILVVLGCSGIAISFGSLGGLDICVALLILAFSLKLIEVRTRRDMYLVYYLAFFIIAAAFLFSQSMVLAIYQIGSITLVLTAMVATQHSLYNRSPGLALRVALKLLGQAVPVMVLFFLVFPRIGPIWSVPDSRSSAGMGMSDSIEPGDIARLNQSSESVFRVEFEGAPPLRQDMYWRGLTLDAFDGRRWSASKAVSPQAASDTGRFITPVLQPQTGTEIEIYGQPLRYRMTMEATQQKWLFALPVANLVSAVGPAASGINTAFDYTLRSVQPLYKRGELEFESYLDFRAAITLEPLQQRAYTRLPPGFNPRARAFARDLKQRSYSADEFVARLNAHFIAQDFAYTLEPPPLGRNSVDDFIFSTRTGYCEHFSNAYAFLLRAAGIPARVVVGYQGGELNPHNQSINVRQLDAHAWVEYWQAGAGWQRIDPTYSVVPERIDLGFDGALLRRPELADADMFSPLYYRNIAFFKAVRLRFEALNHAWQSWVVGFDAAEQQRVLGVMLGAVTPMKMALFVGAVLALLLGLVAVAVLLSARRGRQRRETLLYLAFCQKIARALGLKRHASEAPLHFARRVAAHSPLAANEVQAITRQYMAIAYAGQQDAGSMQALKKAVAQFKPRATA